MLGFRGAAVAAVLLLGSSISAHPGDDHKEELIKRAEWLDQVERRDLSHCSEKLKARGLESRAQARRQELAKHLRRKRGLAATAPLLHARDLATAVNTSHLSPLTGLSADSTGDVLFSDNSTCILNPEVTEGPYYVQGELVRKDITEDQQGVPMTIDIQIVNIETCEPVSDMYLDFWHCNSTGVYSGVNANGNGNADDTTNIDKTFLRGIQPSDDDGVVVFETLFPGHYEGRATHIHIMGHLGASVAENNTLSDQGSIDHVGQIFFDQDLISQVSTVEPYASNEQGLTLNADDMIASQAAEDVDPFATYVLLGSDISDGILSWTTIGVNISAAYSVSAAATIYAEGGVENEDTMQGGPDGAGGPGGAPPGLGSSNGTEAGGNFTVASAGTVAISQATSTASASVATATSGSKAVLEQSWYASALGAAIGAFAIVGW